jgi:muramoyltetrapeptide carboxypeptidase
MLEGFDDFTKEDFMRALTTNDGFKIENPPNDKIETLAKGKATGEIIGGNLTLIVTSLGTEYEIDTKGKLLFIEEIAEHPYKIDRMLTQLRLANKFKDAAGIIFGDFNNCIPKEGHKSFEIKELISQIVVPSGKPIVYNVKSGHCKPMITLPFGVKALLDADNGEIVVLENTVRS